MNPECKMKLDMLAERGIVTSIAYGNCGNGGIMFSVQCLSRSGKEFDKPFGANDFEQAVEIAVIECRERGWL